MRIAVPSAGTKILQASVREALGSLAAKSNVRPCKGCAKTCQICGSTTCRCQCSARCPDAAQMLSSEPDKYPIEAGIVPLVYVLADTGIIQTIWSCEGHLQPSGAELWKTPQVWFSAEDGVAAQLLSIALFDLRESLHCSDWVLRLVPVERGLTSVYSIEPRLKKDEDGARTLELLREDVQTIADRLPTSLRALAASLLSRGT